MCYSFINLKNKILFFKFKMSKDIIFSYIGEKVTTFNTTKNYVVYIMGCIKFLGRFIEIDNFNSNKIFTNQTMTKKFSDAEYYIVNESFYNDILNILNKNYNENGEYIYFYYYDGILDLIKFDTFNLNTFQINYIKHISEIKNEAYNAIKIEKN